MKKSLFAHNITRRDFLNGTSAGMGAMLLGLGAPNALSSQQPRGPRLVKTGMAMAASVITVPPTVIHQRWLPMRTGCVIVGLLRVLTK